MDPELWAMIQAIQQHIDVINRELGEVSTNVEWLQWWVRSQIAAIGITFITTLINTFLLVRNNRKK